MFINIRCYWLNVDARVCGLMRSHGLSADSGAYEAKEITDAARTRRLFCSPSINIIWCAYVRRGEGAASPIREWNNGDRTRTDGPAAVVTTDNSTEHRLPVLSANNSGKMQETRREGYVYPRLWVGGDSGRRTSETDSPHSLLTEFYGRNNDDYYCCMKRIQYNTRTIRGE